MENVILETRNLSRRYKTQQAIRKVNLQLKRGRIYGLIGKNGAGKTTLMRMVAGLGFPTEGEIFLFGLVWTAVICGIGLWNFKKTELK